MTQARRQSDSWDPRRWSPDRWISAGAAVVALSALALSLYTACLERQHKRLSVRPHVLISFYHNEKGAGWASSNSGLGPAMIRWFAVSVDGKPQRDWSAVADALGLPAARPMHFTILAPEEILPAQNTGKLLWIDPSPAADALVRNWERVLIEVCYCSCTWGWR